MGGWTTGPWFYVASMTAEECGIAGGQAADVVVEDDDPTENRSAHGISILDDLSDPDAQLIAAAPALYDALAEAVEHVAGSRDCTHGRGFTYDFCPFNADRDRVQFGPSLADVLAQAAGRTR